MVPAKPMAAAVIHAAFGAGCDLYAVFGVERSAGAKELTKAYRRLALRYVRGAFCDEIER